MKLFRVNQVKDLQYDGTYKEVESFLMLIGIISITRHHEHKNLTIIHLSSGNYIIVSEPIDHIIERIEEDSLKMRIIPKKKNLKLIKPIELDEEDGAIMATDSWGGAGPDCNPALEGVQLKDSVSGEIR